MSEETESQERLLSTLNEKVSLILENLSSSLPNRLKSDLDASLYEKNEMLSVVISSGLQHLQDAVKNYGEKTNQSMDSLVSETTAIKESFSTFLEKIEKFLAQQTELRDIVNKELQVLLALKESLDRFSESVSKRNQTLERALVDVVNALAKKEEI